MISHLPGKSLICALLLIADSAMLAQPADSVFRLTATNIASPRAAADLRLDYVRYYHSGSAAEMLKLLEHPDASPAALQSSRFMRYALDNGIRIIAPLPGWSLDLNHMRAFESYAGWNHDRIDNFPFYDISGTPVYDSAMHGLVNAVRAPTNSSGDVLIAGRPSYLAGTIFFRGDEHLYRRLGLPDRSTFFRVSAALRIEDIPPGYPDSGLLGYVLLYRRVRTGQEECKCNIYEKYDSLPITRRAYLDAPEAGSGYRDVGWTLDFVRSRELRARDSIVIRQTTVAGTVRSEEIFSRKLYTPATFDTLPGRVISSRLDTVAINRIGGGGRMLTILRVDSIQRYQVALDERRGDEWLYGAPGSWFGYGDGACERPCDSLFRAGRFGPNAIREYIEAGDFDMKLFSTGAASVTFLRARINQDMYDLLAAGALDSLMDHDLRPFYASDTLQRLYGRAAFDDETTHQRYRPHGIVARKLLEIMRRHGDTLRGLWQNPIANYDGFRLLTGDLDSAGRTIQLMARQDYLQIGDVDDAIPIYYPNPDSMSWWASHTIFSRTDRITVQGRRYKSWNLIAPNTDSARRQYDRRRQEGFGLFLDSKLGVSVKQGGLVPRLARAVDAANVAYAGVPGPPPLVWNSIQDMGWRVPARPPRDEPGGAWDPWGLRIPTPEEITAQAWLSLNCGVDGLVYTDAEYSGANFGFIHAVDGTHDREYASLLPSNSSNILTAADTLRWREPLMWTGFQSRYNAVKRMNDEIRMLDSVIHFSRLRFRGEQMSVHDPRGSFAAFPLIDTLYAVQARRHAREGKRYLDSTAIDPRGETYLEISRFQSDDGASYLIITNRRCWPVDERTYDTAAQQFGGGRSGLGAIDVRRPVIRFRENAGGLMISRVGHEAEWPAREAVPGEPIPLDWLEPGWGAVYRISPIGRRSR
ncbi:MAG: hypothetical protein ABIR47_00470 [Candidatus Kapaibacterium sp.]